MKFGVCLFFQNYFDWERYESGDFSTPPDTLDADIWAEELKLGDMVEPLNYDALWTVEHHHTPYTMIPDPTQLLSYYAGRTKKVDMGTMVMVLPWHHPLHVAENIALLDLLLDGRKLNIGFGRGASAKEFDPLGVQMEDSRDLFLESLDIVRLALSKPRFSYEGERYVIPETSLRPTPRSKDLADRMYCSWGSPQTLPIAANAGLGMLFIPMKGWDKYAQDVTDFNMIREANGLEPKQPIVVVWVYCSEDEVDAQAAAWTYMGNYNDSAARHYGFAAPDGFEGVRGYEYYQQMAEQRADSVLDMRQAFAEAQVYGTPEQCVEKLLHIQRVTSASEFVGVFRYGGIPIEKAEKSMQVFSEKVLPHIHGFNAVVEPAVSSSAAG